MNKVVIFFLITVFMCANTSIGQLLKIPNLIEHFKEHNNKPNTDSNSFIDFIVSHYSKDSERSHDHENLPFKTYDNSTSTLYVFSSTTYQILTIKPLITGKNKFFYNNFFKSKSITSIWLPPKLF